MHLAFHRSNDLNSTVLRQRLLASGLADAASIHGCTRSELDQIEVVAQRPLPSPYTDFMAHFGKGAGRFMRDVEIFFPEVLHLKPIALEILKDYEELELSLPSSAFVFAVRNKEQFMCFCDIADDPPVQFYMSGDVAISTIAATFWQLIESELDQCEWNYKQVKDTPYDLRP